MTQCLAIMWIAVMDSTWSDLFVVDWTDRLYYYDSMLSLFWLLRSLPLCQNEESSCVTVCCAAAPEVLKSKGYNRSLDMWSVGVITYVRSAVCFSALLQCHHC